MSEMIHGPWLEAASTIAVIDDDGNEMEVRTEDYWQYEADAMRYRPDNNHEGEQ